MTDNLEGRLDLIDSWHLRPERSPEGGKIGTYMGSERGRLLVVAHAERGPTIRIISARPATRRERAQYEEGE